MEMLLESAKLMSKGQVTIPINIRKKMNISEGDQLLFAYDNDKILLVNSATYAMKFMQNIMAGEAKKNGIKEDDVARIVKKIRK